MASVLETIVFEPAKFQQELQAFDELLKSKADLSESKDIRPFFKKSKHLTAYMVREAKSYNGLRRNYDRESQPGVTLREKLCRGIAPADAELS
jgi:hypothetical protein